MVEVVVDAEMDASAGALWGVVADFGNVAWIPGMDGVRVEGDGPGMVRFMPAGEVEIHERLESVDAAQRTLVYTIPKNVPFAVKDYRATMSVTESGSGSRLRWSCTCEPDGISEDEAKQTISGLYEMMVGWIRDYLAKS